MSGGMEKQIAKAKVDKKKYKWTTKYIMKELLDILFSTIEIQALNVDALQYINTRTGNNAYMIGITYVDG